MMSASPASMSCSTVTGSAPAQARVLAMMNAAMYDAVNRTTGSAGAYYVQNVSAPGGDTRAAASQAARNVLVAANAANAGVYDAALASSLAQVGDGAAKPDGSATGAA